MVSVRLDAAESVPLRLSPLSSTIAKDSSACAWKPRWNVTKLPGSRNPRPNWIQTRPLKAMPPHREFHAFWSLGGNLQSWIKLNLFWQLVCWSMLYCSELLFQNLSPLSPSATNLQCRTTMREACLSCLVFKGFWTHSQLKALDWTWAATAGGNGRRQTLFKDLQRNCALTCQLDLFLLGWAFGLPKKGWNLNSETKKNSLPVAMWPFNMLIRLIRFLHLPPLKQPSVCLWATAYPGPHRMAKNGFNAASNYLELLGAPQKNCGKESLCQASKHSRLHVESLQIQ